MRMCIYCGKSYDSNDKELCSKRDKKLHSVGANYKALNDKEDYKEIKWVEWE